MFERSERDFGQLGAARDLLLCAGMLARRLIAITVSAGLASAVYFAQPPEADACGCFTPPDPSVPIVQAGENILFGVENGIVTAHIQVQYSGPAEEFGWLLPLPSIPELGVGTDEVFAQLIATTQPKYVLDAEYVGSCPFDPSRFGGGGGGGAGSPEASDDADGGAPPDSPLVLRDTVGPYDFAVLRADSKDAMLAWLDENRFFVPAGTDDVVDPYIRPGAYFLALKLRKGNDTGDLQPVVLDYESDYPMIPIVLTSVAADPDMGVLVWVLGDHRAIPRNFNHTKINDAKLDWLNAGANYVDVVTDAVDEAEGHNSFVTEYAGTSAIMQNVLAPEWRFGDLDVLRTITDAVEYMNYLDSNGYSVVAGGPPFGGRRYSGQLLAILQSHLPMPQGLIDNGTEPNSFYTDYAFYVNFYCPDNPVECAGLTTEYDAVALTLEIEERVVEATRAANELFETHPYLTRMFTTLSPEEMVKDPVFSYNPDLPEVANEHRGTITYYCDGIDDDDSTLVPAVIRTEHGFKLSLPKGTSNNPWLAAAMPASHFTEVLREEGRAIVVTDNTDAILAAIEGHDGSGGGCSIALTGGRGLPFGLGVLGLVALGWIRRRRQ